MFVKSFACTAVLLGSVMVLPAQSSFDGQDQNGDGVITRNEWRGDMRSFRQADSNRDGVLSGTEIPGMTRGRSSDRRNDRISGEQTRSRAVRLDKDGSGVVEGYEWPYNAQVFHDLDRDANSVLSPDELRNINNVALADLDRNGNKRIEEDEWPGGFAQFEKLDQDGNGRVTSDEYLQRGGDWQRQSRFDAWDRNRDGQIQSNEWQSSSRLFRSLDTNRDSAISRDEFLADQERYLKPNSWRR